MIGVNFQPGSNQDNGQNGQARPPASGVQEAIKVLSLRLPKVVGAQGVTPMPLLTSQGAGGNPRVDSVVNQIMQRIGPMPQQAPAPQTAGPSFGGEVGGMYSTPPSMPNWPTPPQQPPQQTYPAPRIVVDNGLNLPPRWPGQAHVDPGGPIGGPGMIAPIPQPNPTPWSPTNPDPTTPPPPPAPSPDLMEQLRRLLDGGMVGGGGGGGSEPPLF